MSSVFEVDDAEDEQQVRILVQAESSSSSDSFKEAIEHSLHQTPPPPPATAATAKKYYDKQDDFDDFVSATEQTITEDGEPVTLVQLEEIAVKHAPVYNPDLLHNLLGQQAAMLKETEREIFEERVRLSRKHSLNYQSFMIYQQALNETTEE